MQQTRDVVATRLLARGAEDAGYRPFHQELFLAHSWLTRLIVS